MTQAPATPELVERLKAAAIDGWSYDVRLLELEIAAAVAAAHYADALEAQQARIAELEGLFADVNALCTEINKRWEASQALADRYEKALREILEPLAAMKQRADASGRQLSGLAHGIAYSVSHLQDIARQALSSSQGRHEGGER